MLRVSLQLATPVLPGVVTEADESEKDSLSSWLIYSRVLACRGLAPPHCQLGIEHVLLLDICLLVSCLPPRTPINCNVAL
jgi:hypothetical protein